MTAVCPPKPEVEAIMDKLEPLGGMCWKCTRCDWVDCFTAEELALYGEPSECGKNYHESLVEIDLAEGWAALSDRAVVKVRKAERALDAAKAHAAEVERTLMQARAQRITP